MTYLLFRDPASFHVLKTATSVFFALESPILHLKLPRLDLVTHRNYHRKTRKHDALLQPRECWLPGSTEIMPLTACVGLPPTRLRDGGIWCSDSAAAIHNQAQALYFHI